VRTWPGGGPRENFGQIMMHTLSLGKVLPTSSPPLFVQCRSGFSANMTGRRSARARLAKVSAQPAASSGAADVPAGAAAVA